MKCNRRVFIRNPDQEHGDEDFFINELSKHSRWAGMN